MAQPPSAQLWTGSHLRETHCSAETDGDGEKEKANVEKVGFNETDLSAATPERGAEHRQRGTKESGELSISEPESLAGCKILTGSDETVISHKHICSRRRQRRSHSEKPGHKSK